MLPPPLWKQSLVSYKTEQTSTISINSASRYLPKRNDNIFHKKTCTRVFTASLFIIALKWKQSGYPSTGKWF